MEEEKKEEQEQPQEEIKEEKEEKVWVPKTELGKLVLEGKIKDYDEILKSGKKVLEAEIIDYLFPNLKSELVLIGGRTGKGGGQQRIPIRITAKVTKSGKRFHYSAFAIVGNEDGYVGIGRGKSNEPRRAVEKAIRNAKLNLIKVVRGCGSWECQCGGNHSIPFKVEGKSGSVRVVFMPAPKGVGLVCDDETKKLLRLAGIKDIWAKTFGNTSMHINLIQAAFNALKKLYQYNR